MQLAASRSMPGRSRVYTEKHQLDHLPINRMTRSLFPAASSAQAPPILREWAE